MVYSLDLRVIFTLGLQAQAIAEPALGYRDRVPSSMGILNPGMSARILRIDGSRTDCDIAEVGELFLKGRTMTMGYFGNEEATREAVVDLDGEGKGKWLKTGDLVWADKDGNFL
jgi:long-subunit acyl-CoA synthetase (AMP-forming)